MTTGQENIEAVHDPEPEASARFPNRHEAGNQLAAVLTAYRDSDALVLGVPRGGVIVAAAVVRQLGAELDAVISRKITVPAEPELAMGAADRGRGSLRQRAHRHRARCQRGATRRGDCARSRRGESAPGKFAAIAGRRASRTGRSSSSTTGWRPAQRCGRPSVRCGQNILRTS